MGGGYSFLHESPTSFSIEVIMYIQSGSRKEFVFHFVSGAKLIGLCVKELQNEECFIH